MRKIISCLPFTLMAFWLLLTTQAGAAVYDDFNQEGIDSSKWTIYGTPGTQGSSLNRGMVGCTLTPGPSATTGSEKLISTATFGPHFFSLEFFDFSSTNLQPPGSHQGAFVALGLTDGTHYVRIIRDQNGINGTPVGVFEVNYNIGVLHPGSLCGDGGHPGKAGIKLRWDEGDFLL